MVRAGRGCERILLGRAHGGDHPGAGPRGELDRGVTDRSRAACDQHGLSSERVRTQLSRAIDPDREASVRGEGGDADARAQIEGRSLGQGNRLRRRQRHQLLGAAVRPVPCGLPEPDPLPHPAGIDLLPRRHHRPRSVHVRDDLGEGERSSGTVAPARLPIGWIHARHRDTDEHLVPARRRIRSLDELQHVRTTCFRVHDRSHGGRW